MQAKKRYILVIISCAFLAYCYFGGYRLKSATPNDHNDSHKNHLKSYHTNKNAHRTKSGPSELPSFTTYRQKKDFLVSGANDLAIDNSGLKPIGSSASDATGLISSNGRDLKPVKTGDAVIGAGKTQSIDGVKRKQQRSCRMETCFDFTKCYDNFLVYVYPPEPVNSLGASPPISPNYQKIISVITESRYYTKDPEKACLFVLGIDTLDRDSLSDDYVRNVPSRLQRLPYWNNGRNHIIFNLYSGTWPDYVENSLGFDPGDAILAKASMSIQQMRPGFDVSIPLFHKHFPLRAGNTGTGSANNFPANKKYLLAFKGKR